VEAAVYFSITKELVGSQRVYSARDGTLSEVLLYRLTPASVES